MDELRKKLKALSLEQRAALKERLSQQKGKSAELPSATASGMENYVFPASFAQQRLWFLDQFEPGSPLYNVAHAQHLEGALDVQALEQSLNAIIARHEVLRTTFAVENGQPVQVIASVLEFPLPVTGLEQLSPRERQEEVRRFYQEEAQRPFDLARGPLIRARLLRLAEQEHVLLLTLHHIISDGWSTGVLFRELAICYRAFNQGRQPDLMPLPIQYADFAVWQRDWLQGEVLEQQLEYWRHQLDGAPILELPTDRPRPAVQSYRGDSISIVLPETLCRQLKALNQKEGVTLFMTLLAAFQVLLHRYSGQDDIVIGSAIAGRNRTEIEGLIGFFVNSLVLRVDLSGEPGFRELLGRVRKMALEAYAHQDVPFEKLVEELLPERNLGRNPLFQVMFVLQNTPDHEWSLPALKVTPLKLSATTAKFDLSLSLTETKDCLQGVFNFNTDLFDRTTIERMAGHFQVLLEGIVADPECCLSTLLLIQPEDARLPLEEWNRTETDYPRDAAIQQLFEAQVARNPEAVALICGERQVSYGELNVLANQLANYLQKQGVGPETLVAILLPRSLESVVAIIAILKAGGAYVPLDPAYPKKRLALMLEDSAAPLLLTLDSLCKKLPSYEGKILCLDAEEQQINKEEKENLEHQVCGDNLAYIIYTSGSTGLPKGVEVPHRGVLRLVCGVDYVQLDSNQTFLLLASLSFDASTFELWGVLLHGARCVIYPEEIPSISSLGVAIEQHGVSVLWLTASLFNLIIDEAPDILRGVNQLLTGGEALSAPHVRRALEYLPETQIINGYGPTENTTFTCCYSIPRPLPENLQSIPIGRPISNTQVYILDGNLNPVPIGVPGELYIGGDGLARGYHQREELTAQKFIPKSFGSDPAARLYRTGDRVRYLQEGEIEFLGRLDNQIKIRGFRIELGEIEAALLEYPEIRYAVVLAPEGNSGDRRLVAYIVPDHGQPINIARVRNFLEEQLPKFMLPSAFVELEQLPLNANGKVDRAVLIALEPEQHKKPENHGTPRTPRTPLEQDLAKIWADVLDLEQVGIHENFFDLGGHSLLATQLISRIRSQLQNELPLRILFERPTVAGLAEYINNLTETGQPDPMPSAVQRTERDELLFPGAQDNRMAGTAQPVHSGTGKRGSLPAVDSLEQLLIPIWEEVLGVSPISIHDDFFDLGGHSLLAVELVHDIEKKLGESLSLVILFQNPTIAALVKVLRTPPQPQAYPKTMAAVREKGSRQPFFCVSGRQETLVRHLHPEQPFYWLGYITDGGRILDLPVEEIAAIQIQNILEVQPSGPYRLGGFSFGGAVAFEMAQQLHRRGEEVCLLALFDPSTPHMFKSRDQGQDRNELMKRRFSEIAAQPGIVRKGLAAGTKLRNWLMWRARGFPDRMKKRYRRLLTSYFIASSRTLPSKLCAEHNLELLYKVARSYEFQAYPHRITLFVPGLGKDPEERIRITREQWRDIALNGVDICLIKDAPGHVDIIEEPYIEDLVNQLNDCLTALEAEETAVTPARNIAVQKG